MVLGYAFDELPMFILLHHSLNEEYTKIAIFTSHNCKIIENRQNHYD